MKAFITGITGQDGSYLAELLISKNYEVHGTIRRSSSINTEKIDHLISNHQGDNLFLYYSDLLDSSSLTNLISNIRPNEVYNLAAQSHVAVSFQNPLFTTETSTVGPLSLLESIRNIDKDIKFYQAFRIMKLTQQQLLICHNPPNLSPKHMRSVTTRHLNTLSQIKIALITMG